MNAWARERTSNSTSSGMLLRLLGGAARWASMALINGIACRLGRGNLTLFRGGSMIARVEDYGSLEDARMQQNVEDTKARMGSCSRSSLVQWKGWSRSAIVWAAS